SEQDDGESASHRRQGPLPDVDQRLLVRLHLLRGGRVVRRRGGGLAQRRDVGLLGVDHLSHQAVRHAEQGPTGDQEQSGEQQRQANTDGQPGHPAGCVHAMRYPTPVTVCTTSGSPSLRRSVITVTRSTLVNGSTFSSQAFSSRNSALTTAPSARSSSSSTLNSLRDTAIGRSFRNTSRRLGSSRSPARLSTGGGAGRERRPRARTRAVSSARANGLDR